MPKLKTHKGTAKRFRLTKNGKLMRMKAARSHLRRKKKASKKSDYRHPISTTDKTMIKLVKTATGNNASSGNGKHTGNR
ncbi:MAG: bL35 family ribosomal protein [Caldilineaceae bacterium]